MAKVSGQIGDGFNTAFDVSTGFDTENAAIRLFDLTRDGQEVIAFQAARQTPDDMSVRITLTPAPALDGVQYSISDGTEEPDSAV